MIVEKGGDLDKRGYEDGVPTPLALLAAAAVAIANPAVEPVPFHEVPLPEIQARAAQGEPAAEHELGQRLYYGIGVAQDKAQALAWETKAAEQDFLPACWEVAGIYYWAEELKDDAKAVAWFKRGAEHGSASCQNRLGMITLAGELVPKDAAAAVGWLRKAASQDHREAQANLGWCLVTGQGVAADPPAGLALIRQAVEHGCPIAPNYLMRCYQEGLGVEPSLEEAYFWAMVACRGFVFEATPGYHELPEERRAALKQRAESWLEAHPL
jgi:hypothetical protein